MSRFYVYLFLRTDGTPYYVGKGTGNRQWRRRRGGANLPADPARNIRILDGMSEEDAHAWEKLLIARWGCKHNGTGILRNLTDGGEGASNPPESVRAKLSAALTAVWSDPGARAKMIALQTATQSDIEARARNSAAVKAAKSTPDARAKTGAKSKASWENPDVRAKRVASMKAVANTPEFRIIMSEASKAVWSDPEYQAKMSVVRKAAGPAISKAKAAKGAEELGFSLDAYMAMTPDQRSIARRKKREGTSGLSRGEVRASKGAAELGVPLAAYMAMTIQQRYRARKNKREANCQQKAPA